MGLSVSQAIWQNFIQRVLQEISNYRKNHLAIMDDILTHIKREGHIGHLIDLFQSQNKEWFKDLSKKVQTIQEITCVHGDYHHD